MKAPDLVPNLPDDMHCVQCCAKMAIDYFHPERKVTIKELEKATAFGPNGTWEMHELLNYESFGIKARELTVFDYEAFAEDAPSYLKEFFGERLATQFLEQTTDINQEMKRARKVLSAGLVEKRVPSKEDIKAYVNKGWLVIPLVNIRKLRTPEEDGYMGHRIVIYDTNKDGVYVNDPGLPAHARKFIDWTMLEKAWADPNPETKEMMAVTKL